MVRYHGVLASRSKLRSEVVPQPPPSEADPLQLQAELELALGDEHRPRRKPWAWLLRHARGAGCPRTNGQGGRELFVPAAPDPPRGWRSPPSRTPSAAPWPTTGSPRAGLPPSRSAGPRPTSSSACRSELRTRAGAKHSTSTPPRRSAPVRPRPRHRRRGRPFHRLQPSSRGFRGSSPVRHHDPAMLAPPTLDHYSRLGFLSRRKEVSPGVVLGWSEWSPAAEGLPAGGACRNLGSRGRRRPNAHQSRRGSRCWADPGHRVLDPGPDHPVQ